MRLLIDTQIVILASQTPFRLSKKAMAAIVDPANDRYVSLISLWEIAIKRRVGKLLIPDPTVDQTLIDLAADELPLERKHLRVVSGLPLHHRDPFDRLLIAQAIAENLTIVTADRSFAAYGVKLIPA